MYNYKMVKTNYYDGLNPVVMQALNNLQYRYSDETPEMWYFLCSLFI